MQWLWNLFYSILDTVFSFLGSFETPSFISDLTLAITKYCVIVNYYFPLDVLVSVAAVVVVATGILMIISAVLQVL